MRKNDPGIPWTEHDDPVGFNPFGCGPVPIRPRCDGDFPAGDSPGEGESGI